VLILEQVFSKTAVEAMTIMLSVHRAGSGLAGLYPKEVAETKIAVVQHMARKEGFPLQCTMEQA
jgi:ATP-dependent Clp protease adaptor protein ClpS